MFLHWKFGQQKLYNIFSSNYNCHIVSIDRRWGDRCSLPWTTSFFSYCWICLWLLSSLSPSLQLSLPLSLSDPDVGPSVLVCDAAPVDDDSVSTPARRVIIVNMTSTFLSALNTLSGTVGQNRRLLKSGFISLKFRYVRGFQQQLRT